MSKGIHGEAVDEFVVVLRLMITMMIIVVVMLMTMQGQHTRDAQRGGG